MRASQITLVALLATITCVRAGLDRYHPDLEKSQRVRNVNNVNSNENSADFWKNEALAGIDKRLKEVTNNKVARNVIMFLGDGMSIPTLMAARTLKGQRGNRTGEESELFFESFPTVGLSKTYCLDQQIADSACTATAYLAGVKNNHGTIGVTGAVKPNDCERSTEEAYHVDSIAAWALEDGRDAGFVTTTRVTHASPAGTFAKTANRYWETDADIVGAGFTTDMCSDITHQLVHTYPGKDFKVILGGGRRTFIPTTATDDEGFAGRRTDGRDLIEEWQNDKESRGVTYQYVWNRNDLLSLKNSPPEYLLGLFESSHLQYNLQMNTETEPTLAELTEVAINSLSRNEKGYFLFVESGRIDHAHHENQHHMALDETIEFDLAIKKAVELTGDDTLIVVTADHAHVMAINGYTSRGSDILGASDTLGTDGTPYLTLSYTNGPGARVHQNGIRPDVTQESGFINRDPVWMVHAEVPLRTETHGGDDVAVMAYGPHHHMFTGVYEQSQIAWRMAYAACIGPGSHSEYCNNAAIHQPLIALYAIVLTVVYRVLQS